MEFKVIFVDLSSENSVQKPKLKQNCWVKAVNIFSKHWDGL